MYFPTTAYFYASLGQICFLKIFSACLLPTGGEAKFHHTSMMKTKILAVSQQP